MRSMKLLAVLFLFVFLLALGFLLTAACLEEDDEEEEVIASLDDDESDDDVAPDGDDDTDDDTEDDDAADDDVTDDDVSDDDDLTIDEVYAYDDGTHEFAVTGVTDEIYALTFKPSSYPAYLTEVSFYVTALPGGPDAIQVVILADENSDGPEDSEIVYTSHDLTVDTAPGWFQHDAASNGFGTSLESGAWIVGVKAITPGAVYLGIDDSTLLPTSWFRDVDGWSTDIGFYGIMMIRGKGYYEP